MKKAKSVMVLSRYIASLMSAVFHVVSSGYSVICSARAFGLLWLKNIIIRLTREKFLMIKRLF